MDDEEAGLHDLKEKIQVERGFNCHLYKDKCLRRRLAVRMRARGEPTYVGYAALLDREPAEYDLLLDTLTINVTKFFRDPDAWAVVEQQVIPELFAGGAGERRIWSAGCASGEEPYSVSILLHEWARRNGRDGEMARFRVTGTDIDGRSLDAARRAEYTALSLTDTPEAVRERWFSPGPHYRLDPKAQEGVEFARHDLISEPPPGGQQLILCRNVIIYFDRGIQEELFLRFHDALVPGGILVLGKVETLLGRARTLFRPVSSRERVFRRPR